MFVCGTQQDSQFELCWLSPPPLVFLSLQPEEAVLAPLPPLSLSPPAPSFRTARSPAIGQPLARSLAACINHKVFAALPPKIKFKRSVPLSSDSLSLSSSRSPWNAGRLERRRGKSFLGAACVWDRCCHLSTCLSCTFLNPAEVTSLATQPEYKSPDKSLVSFFCLFVQQIANILKDKRKIRRQVFNECH